MVGEYLYIVVEIDFAQFLAAGKCSTANAGNIIGQHDFLKCRHAAQTTAVFTVPLATGYFFVKICGAYIKPYQSSGKSAYSCVVGIYHLTLTRNNQLGDVRHRGKSVVGVGVDSGLQLCGKGAGSLVVDSDSLGIHAQHRSSRRSH